jgi:hypothetical protein
MRFALFLRGFGATTTSRTTNVRSIRAPALLRFLTWHAERNEFYQSRYMLERKIMIKKYLIDKKYLTIILQNNLCIP